MQNLHLKLTSKYPQYNNWHQTKHHNTIHWGVLVGFTFLLSTLILNPLYFSFDSYNSNSSLKVSPSISKAQTTLEIPLTIEEPAGIARTDEPVSSGIPLPQGTIVNTQEWSLWDGAIELPLQVTKLPGRTPWILLDFPVSVNANEKKTLTLKQIPSTTLSSNPLTITEDTNQITISNKIIKTTLTNHLTKEKRSLPPNQIIFKSLILLPTKHFPAREHLPRLSGNTRAPYVQPCGWMGNTQTEQQNLLLTLPG